MTTINNLTIEQMREIVSKAPSNAESYQGGYYFRESPQFMFHNGFHDQWNLTDNDGLYFRAAGFHPVRIDDLRTAIAEHDREFKVGDLVVSTWGLEKRVLKIVLKPKFKNGILYLTLLIDGVKRECLAQWWRQATNEEIALGFRS